MTSSPEKSVLITGVSRGLGLAMIPEFVQLGFRVIGCARSTSKIDDLQATYPDHQFVVLDVTNADSVQAFADSVTQTIGAPDLIINNAALINSNNKLWKIEVDEFSQVVDVNIKGVFHVIRAFTPGMIQRGSGVIVNFSSGWGRSTSPDVAPYCATKFAIEGITGAMAAELPAGMATVALNPGIIHTEMLESCFGEYASSYPDAKAWAKVAVPFMARLDSSSNGDSLSVPAF